MFKRAFSYRLLSIGLGIIVMGYCTEGFGQKPVPHHRKGGVQGLVTPRSKAVGPGPVTPLLKAIVPGPATPRPKAVGPGPVTPSPKVVGPGPVAPHPKVVGPGPVAPHPNVVGPPPILPFGKPVVKLPVGYISVPVGGIEYFFHAGVFYQKRPHGLIVAPHPIGAIIPSIPFGFQVVVIGGLTYYCYGGAYYQRVPSGYIVVEAPPGVITVEKPSVLIQVPETARGRVSVTANTLNVRSGPGANRPVIRYVYQGNILAIYGNAPGWLYVKLPSGKFGWVMQKFTVQVSPPASG